MIADNDIVFYAFNNSSSSSSAAASSDPPWNSPAESINVTHCRLAVELWSFEAVLFGFVGTLINAIGLLGNFLSLLVLIKGKYVFGFEDASLSPYVGFYEDCLLYSATCVYVQIIYIDTS